jgi:hypothetical protein
MQREGALMQRAGANSNEALTDRAPGAGGGAEAVRVRDGGPGGEAGGGSDGAVELRE